MRSRRQDVMRPRSPPVRGHQSEWYSGSYSRRQGDRSHRDDERTKNPPPRRSLSPMDRDRGRRMRGSSRGRASVERREFRRHAYEKGDHLRRRSPFESRRPLPAGNREMEGHLQFNDGFSCINSSPPRFGRGFLLPERHGIDLDANHGLRLGGGRISEPAANNNDKDLPGAPRNGGSALDGQGVLSQKSIFLNDGNSHSFYALQSERYPLEDINLRKQREFPPTDDALGSDIRYDDFGSTRLQLNKMPVREPYEVEGQEKLKFYSRDRPYLPLSPTSKTLGSSSSGIPRGSFFPSSSRSSLHFPSGEFARGGKSSNLSIDDGPGPSELFDPIRDPEMHLKDGRPYQKGVSPLRDDRRSYIYPELGRRERGLSGFGGDDLYRKMQLGGRGNYSLRDNIHGSGFMEPIEDKVNADTSRRSFLESTSWEHQLHGKRDEILHGRSRHSLADERHEEFLTSRKFLPDFGTESGQDHTFKNLADDYAYGREGDALVYDEASKGSLHGQEMYRYPMDTNPQHTEELGNIPPGRSLKPKYGVASSRLKMRISVHNDRRTSRRIQEVDIPDEHWVDEDRGGRSFVGVSQRLGPDSWLSMDDASEHVKGGFVETRFPTGRNILLRKRSRPSASDFIHPFHGDSNQGHQRTFKLRKPYKVERNAAIDMEDEKQQDESSPQMKPDPPENSEEFKQLVHKAFLRFSKQLNENPGQQRRYRGQGKAGNLVCLACGSLSREFIDAHSLVTHAYNSLKVGLRIDHLGLHKALCVLLGWNSLVAPDSRRVYQSLAAAEASALKEDLLLWPPVVIIHDTSRSWNAEKTDSVTIDDVEETLRGMGFSGKAKVYRGRPANQGVFVAKFFPTFSGLREAERLHRHYGENNRGKEELQRLKSKIPVNGSANQLVETASRKPAEFLYGYIGIAEDLDKLDFESKKRCLVKSKKDIEAIADAALDSE
ncbi:uncharacterized protein LOC116264148 [Nymphaea colorata]|nr:uncharacterized protein LOC116264148 [Nymphaea colorata]XP_031500049.1 uncharacterized protein LOC116264148 [Nymphaea colorata]XP_031500050.1 uncharacterized protein LOC116264148 [Nymphaea colorata]